MVTVRNTRSDVIAAAGRLFAERGYHGTSMRDLGRELGLLGSSLYSHVESKQDLLVAVVEEGARLFSESAAKAAAREGDALDRLYALVAGHIDVILDHRDVARTFLDEARMLDEGHRARVLAARDRYEETFRVALRTGIDDGSIRADVDPKLTSILILSTLNAIPRWYRPDGPLDRRRLTEVVWGFVVSAIQSGPG